MFERHLCHMGIPLLQVDAFTSEPYHGNPAAICLLPAPHPDAWMQAVAAEMNLSETAFLEARPDGWALRWFTPRIEVALCGHATLASAHVLWERGDLAEDADARFHTRSGLLTCRRRDGWIEMDFPADPVVAGAPPAGLLQALGVTPKFVGQGRYDYLVEVDTEATIHGLAPDMPTLAAVKTRGVIVTAPSDSASADFVSRFFAPAAGIPEDPVTGSAHCTLASHWTPRFGKPQLTGRQISQRGGIVRCRVERDRVILGGQAVTILKAELLGSTPRVGLRV